MFGLVFLDVAADGSMTPVRTGLRLGGSWTIPGTRLHAVVTSLAPTRASLRFSPSTASSPVPPIDSPASVVVWAVGENGLRTASVPLRVSPTGDK